MTPNAHPWDCRLRFRGDDAEVIYQVPLVFSNSRLMPSNGHRQRANDGRREVQRSRVEVSSTLSKIATLKTIPAYRIEIYI